MSAVFDLDSLVWPADVAIAASRVTAGSPVASTLVAYRNNTTEMGLWRVSPGAFSTVHDGYVEFIHVIAGDADLVHDDGTVISLRAGSVILLEPGWSGRWIVRETLVKSYTTVLSR